MRKFTLTFLLVALSVFLNAQSGLFSKVKKAIELEHPEIITENKLIAINIWSADDAASREANKQFNNVYKIYEFAKLKGGLKGIVCVAINKDGESASIILTKDGATKLIQLHNIDLSGVSNSNSVFDDKGVEVYKNITSDKVFESINNLITR
ncbi:MAG: hypothetical protein H0W73_15730 [Bacteroidetes bacterium]|nr:hypothetical protein [Bacteroidota bacterium]